MAGKVKIEKDFQFGNLVDLGRLGEDREVSDYRPVPASDDGETYTDHGSLGWYSPSEEPFKNPPGVKMFTGYGGNREDLDRGYCKPTITNHPAYELENRKDRWSDPSVSDQIHHNVEVLPSDYEFRSRNRESKGFMTRPRIPKDRN